MTEVGRATVLMPGTCGELVQGLVDDLPFLVSCPIDRYSAVSVVLETGGAAQVEAPASAPKAAAAVRAALDHFRCGDLRARLSIASSLPCGKGLGSSTADVAGAIFAVAHALRLPIDPGSVAALAVTIEPSDASMFPNIARFDHRKARYYEDLGPPPPLEIVVLDFGGEVDTIAFNWRDWSALLREGEPIVAEALGLVRRGIREGRPDLIGRGATLSAEANQRILYKPELAAVKELAEKIGAVGVNVGHSGTVIGILVDPQRGSAQEALLRARGCFPSLGSSFACRLVGGGYRLPAGVM